MQLKNKRTSNFELLRIFSIILIIMQHFAYYTKFNYDIKSFESFYIYFLEIFGKLGVFLFVIITGYFYEKNEGKIIKYIKIIIKIFAYSILCLIIAFIFNGFISLDNIIRSILPCSFGLYWFATCYLLLIIFAPYLNILVKEMDYKRYIKFLITVFFIICIIAMIPKTNVYYNELFMFIFIYFIGAFLKKFDVTLKPKCIFKLLFLCMSSYIIITILFKIVSFKIIVLQNYLMIPFYLNSPVVLFGGIIIFLLFKNIKLNNSIINNISKNTFGVYLIHENIFLRDLIWNKFLNKTDFYGFKLIIFSIFKIILVFCICLILSYLIDKIVLGFLYKIIDNIKNLYLKRENL